MLAPPDTDAWCVRLAPCDPAYRLFAEDVEAGPREPHLPRISALLELGGSAFAVVLERLHPAEPVAAQAFCVRLGWPSPNEDAPVETSGPDPRLSTLRERLLSIDRRGAARYPRLWGGSDVRAGNVMIRGDGTPTLVDPVFLAGARVGAALLAGDRETLAELTSEELDGFLEIAAFHREVDRYDGLAELRAAREALRAADAQPG